MVTGEDGCRGLLPFVWEVDSADTDAKISERADQHLVINRSLSRSSGRLFFAIIQTRKRKLQGAPLTVESKSWFNSEAVSLNLLKNVEGPPGVTTVM